MDPNTLRNEASLHEKCSYSDIASVSTISSQDGSSVTSEKALLPDQKKISTGRLVLVLGSLWVIGPSLYCTYRHWLTLLAKPQIGVLLVALDSNMVATILLPISDTFHSTSSMSWFATTFSIACSATQPVSGHLTDVYGRRNGLLLSYAFFLAGTLICGLAPKLSVFLLGRILQGLGGGGITSITAFLETDLVPIERRAFIEGLGNVAFGVTTALAGIYGGSVNDTIGWRWAFLIQVPAIAIMAGITAFVIKDPIQKINLSGWRQIDFVGGISLLAATVLLQLGLTTSMPTPVVCVSLPTAGISFAIFVYWELRVASHPVIPIAAMADCTVALSQLSAFFASASYAGIIYYIPIYLQVTGNSSSKAGLRFIPLALAFGIGSFFSGLVVTATARYYYVNLAIQAVEVLAGSLICTLTANTPSFAPFIYLALLGLGEGGACVTILMALLSATDGPNQTAVQAAVWSIKSIGSSLGVTAASKLFQEIFSKALVNNLGSNSNTDISMSVIQNITSTLELPDDLSNQSIKSGVLDAYMTGLRAVFFLSLGVVVLAAGLSLGIKNNLLSSSEDDLSEKGSDESDDTQSNTKSENVEQVSLSDDSSASIDFKADYGTKRRCLTGCF